MDNAIFYTGEKAPIKKCSRRTMRPRRQSPYYAGPFKYTGFRRIFIYKRFQVVQKEYEAPDNWKMYEEYVTDLYYPGISENFTVFYAVRGDACVRGDTLRELIARWQMFLSKGCIR